MKYKFVALIVLAAVLLSFFATGCTVVSKIKAPYYVPNPYQRFTKTQQPTEGLYGTVEITLAKNEGEGAQLCVRSDNFSYYNMRISASDLTDGLGHVIDKSCISLFREEYNTNNGIAHILLPLSDKDFAVTDAVVGNNLIYYIKVTTPVECEAGTYTGTLTLSHDGGEFEVSMKVRILDFTLQTSPMLRSDLLYWNFAGRYYNNELSDEKVRSLYRQALDICRENKLNVSNAYDVPNFMTYFRGRDENGKLICDTEGYIADMKQFLAENPTVSTINAPIAWNDYENCKIDPERSVPFLNALRDAGLLDMCILYRVDEPHNDGDFENLNRIGAWIDEYCPDLKNYSPVLLDKLDLSKVNPGAIDIWCYAYGGATADDLLKGQTGERELWAYAFDKSCNRSFSQVRLMGWECKKFNIKGIEDWCLDAVIGGYENGEWVIDYNAAMTQSYVYPGRIGDGIVNKVAMVPTFVVENFRDAVEDYEYLTILQNKVQARIDELGLSMSVYDAMESYYDGVFHDVDVIPAGEEAGFKSVRERVINEIENGVPYIMTTTLDAVKWTTDNRYITIYTDKNATVVFDGQTLEKKTEGNYSVSKVYKQIGSESKAYEVECNGITTTQYMLTKDSDKALVLDLSQNGLYEKLKEVNPNTEFEIYDDNGRYVLKIIFGSGTKRGFVIPAELMSSPVGDYYKLKLCVWPESGEAEQPIVAVMSSESGKIDSYKQDSDGLTPITLSFEKLQAITVGKNLVDFRLTLGKSYTEPITLYFSDMYFINDNNNFKWEIVE